MSNDCYWMRPVPCRPARTSQHAVFDSSARSSMLVSEAVPNQSSHAFRT